MAEELQETQRVRNEYFPLRVVKKWGELVDASVNSNAKRLIGFSGMMGVVVLAMIIDGKFAIVTAETLAVLGGATIGEKLPLLSGQIEFVKEKRAVKNLKKEQSVSVEDIANLLCEFSDIVPRKEVELWTEEKLGGEFLERPERYRIMQAVLKGNPKSPGVVVEGFMEAQKLAQEKRRSKKYMRKEAFEKAGDIAIGVVLMAGVTNAVSFGLGYQAQAGIVGLADDVVLYGVLAYSFSKQKIKSFFSKY